MDDKRLEIMIGNLLRSGVLLAAAVVLFGAVVFLVRHGSARPDYETFHGEPASLRTVSGIFKEVREGHGRGIIQLGVLLLILTPISRVAFSAVGFALEKDRLYVFITVLVLAILLFSLTGRSP